MRRAFEIVGAFNPQLFTSSTPEGVSLEGFEILRDNLHRARPYIDVNAHISESGATLLHAMNSSTDSSLLVRDLIAHGANVNAADHKGDTPLHTAILDIGTNYPIELLASGASVRRRNHGQFTAIDCLNAVHHYHTPPELIDIHTYEQRIMGRIQTAEECLSRYQESGAWHLLSREEVLLLANIDAHWQAFDCSHWRGHEQQALDLIASLPPFLQEELSPQLETLYQTTIGSSRSSWSNKISLSSSASRNGGSDAGR